MCILQQTDVATKHLTVKHVMQCNMFHRVNIQVPNEVILDRLILIKWIFTLKCLVAALEGSCVTLSCCPVG